MMRTPTLRVQISLVTAALIPWAVIFAFPLVSLFGVPSFFGPENDFFQIFDPILINKVRFTLGQAGISAAAAGFLGLPLGLVLRRSPRAASWLRLPFAVPSLVAAVAWVSILSSSPLRYSVWAVLLAHVVFNIPWVAFSVAEAAASVPQGWDDLARSLGAKGWVRLRTVFFPVLAPVWLSACVQVFVFCSMSFALVLFLGGGPPVETLETAIYSSVRTGALDLMMAARLAFWQLMICVGPWLLTRVLWRPIPLSGPALKKLEREPFWHQLVGLIWVLPYFAFFKDLNWGIFFSASFWSSIWYPFLMSLQLSATVAILSVFWVGLGTAALLSIQREKVRKVLELILLLPSGVSTLTTSMAFWIAYAQWVDPFEGSFVALALIQALIFFPVVFRVLWPLLQNPTTPLRQLARSLGASSLRSWWEVEWPRVRKSVFQCMLLVSAASLGELSAVSFFSSEKLQTLPLLVSRAMAQYRFEYASVVAAFLFLASALMAMGFRVERAR